MVFQSGQSARSVSRLLLLAVVCWACWSTGCVSRRLMINSEPAGALVLVDGEEIGYTPCAMDFTYYGTREITLMKDGYETLTVMQPVNAPWYQVPPLDFFSDNFLGTHVTDRRQLFFQLEPQQPVNTQDLINRANGTRTEARLGP